jgi:hypothetical protein
VIIATNSANSAGYEMGVARVLVLHENAVTSEDGGRAVALDHLAVREVDLGKDSQTSDNSSDGIPGHLHDVAGFGSGILSGYGLGFHLVIGFQAFRWRIRGMLASPASEG